MTRFVRLTVPVLAALVLPGCGAAMIAGDLIRSGQREIEIAFSPGVDAARLASVGRIGLRINPVDAATGQYLFATGSGTTSVSVYSDMVALELTKAGYDARPVTFESTSDPSAEERQVLTESGLGLLLVGNVNMTTTTSASGLVTGGNWQNTGVNHFTIRGLDVVTGDALFIISGRYGKAKGAEQVAVDIAQAFRGAGSGSSTADRS